nr:MAG TPA: hypothetical protein [Caudoviricetes sp.]
MLFFYNTSLITSIQPFMSLPFKMIKRDTHNTRCPFTN